MKILKKHVGKLLFTFGIVLTLYLRFLLKDFISGDYESFLVRWINYFRDNGGIYAIKDIESDYNVIYQYLLIIISYFRLNDLYLVKLFSVIFDFLLAFGTMALIRELGGCKKKQLVGFFLILLLPTVILNSAMWAQCDSIYAAFIVWSLYFLIKEKPCISIIYITLAFAFKLQTIFVAPIFLVALLYKKIKLRHILVFPVVYFATIIPALIFGKPLKDIFMVYFTQAQQYPMMTMNSASIFGLLNIEDYSVVLEKISISVMIIFVLTIIFLICRKKISWTPNFVFSSAFVFSLIIPFLLPHMHDRYFYIAEILSVIYVVHYGKKRIYIPIMLQLAGLIVYAIFFGFIEKNNLSDLYIFITAQNAGIIVFIGLILLLINYLYDYFKKNPDVPRFKTLIISAVLSLAVSISGIAYLSWEIPEVRVDNRKIHFIVRPFKDNNTLMLPVKNFFLLYGAEISYDAKLNAIAIKDENREIRLRANSNEALVDNESVILSKPCVLKNYLLFISAEDITKLLGLNLEYENGKKLEFTKKQKK